MPEPKKPTKIEIEQAIRDEDELLADMPELRAPNRLRMRDRSRLMLIADNLQRFTNADKKISSAKLKDPKIAAQSWDAIADVDDFAADLALDADEYDDWRTEATLPQFSAILTRYARAVGESLGSSH